MIEKETGDPTEGYDPAKPNAVATTDVQESPAHDLDSRVFTTGWNISGFALAQNFPISLVPDGPQGDSHLLYIFACGIINPPIVVYNFPIALTGLGHSEIISSQDLIPGIPLIVSQGFSGAKNGDPRFKIVTENSGYKDIQILNFVSELILPLPTPPVAVLRWKYPVRAGAYGFGTRLEANCQLQLISEDLSKTVNVPNGATSLNSFALFGNGTRFFPQIVLGPFDLSFVTQYSQIGIIPVTKDDGSIVGGNPNFLWASNGNPYQP